MDKIPSYMGKIVVYEGKKGKVIEEKGNELIVVLKDNGKFFGEKKHIDNKGGAVTLLDRRKNPEKYIKAERQVDFRRMAAIKDMFEPKGGVLYIDSWTQEAFDEAGGGSYISQEELAALGQVFRSSHGIDIFQGITGILICGKTNMKTLFTSAAQGKINLSEIIKSPLLKRYTERKSAFAFD